MTPPPIIFSTRFWALVRLILNERRAHGKGAKPSSSDEEEPR